MVVPLLLSTLGALVVSVCATATALAYTRRRGMLDLPGKRRSHTSPTPRGGGAGIVVAVLLVGLPAWRWLDAASAWVQLAAIAVALVAVAVVGWRDDHMAMSPLPRLLVHVVAALLVIVALRAAGDPMGPWSWWLWPPLAVVLVGSINAHNFMDGIDGILGQQGLFVMLGYAALALATSQAGLAGFALATAAGCLGFLFFNVPPARVFMGDVGSGALGLLIGVVAMLVVLGDPSVLWACLILPSAFLVDSGLTLLRRVVGRQRWYAPHRQHLYQWLVRVRWSHVRVDAAYLAWNLVIVTPLAWVAARWPGIGAACCALAYTAGAITWLVGKRACLASARQGAVREPA